MTADVLMGIRITHRLRVVHRGVPPANCRMGCPEWSGILIAPTEICKTCVQRPVKSDETEEFTEVG